MLHPDRSLLAAVALVVSCTTADPGDSGERASTLGQVTTVRLEERPHARLVRPSSVTQAPNGDLVIGDRVQGAFLRFTASGQFVGFVGRKGAGPGEFESPRTVAFLGDSLLVGIDPGLRRAQRFRLDGTLVGPAFSIPFDFSMAAWDSTGVWFGGSNVVENYSILHWNGNDSVGQALVTLPDSLRSWPLLMLLGGGIPLPAGDTLIVGYGPGMLRLAHPRSGRTFADISVPHRDRRGLSADAIAAAQVGDGMGVINAASSLAALGRLSDGGLALVYRDLTRTQVGFTGVIYLTILDSSFAPMCIDAPVPLLAEEAPLMWFAGDTLLVFEQSVVSVDSVESVVRRWPIRPSAKC